MSVCKRIGTVSISFYLMRFDRYYVDEQHSGATLYSVVVTSLLEWREPLRQVRKGRTARSREDETIELAARRRT